MGYHRREIPRGLFGMFSKIEEEFLEVKDAVEQGVKIMTLVELSDLIGAIEGYAQNLGCGLDDLIDMKNKTHEAFNDGSRKART